MTRPGDTTLEPKAVAPLRPAPKAPARRFGASLHYAVSITVGLFLWPAVASQYEGFVLAAPLAVLQRLWALTLDGSLPRALADASRHMLLGFAISTAIALPLGLAMGRSRAVREMVDPVVSLLYAVPAIAWAPLIMIWFGLFFEARVALVVLMCSFDMLIVVAEGARQVDPRQIAVGRSFGASRWQLTRSILLPAMVPFIFASLRIGVIRAVNAMVTAELFLAAVNLGSIMKQASVRFDSAAVLGVLVVMSVLGLVLQELLLALEQRACRWQRKV